MKCYFSTFNNKRKQRNLFKAFTFSFYGWGFNQSCGQLLKSACSHSVVHALTHTHQKTLCKSLECFKGVMDGNVNARRW